MHERGVNIEKHQQLEDPVNWRGRRVIDFYSLAGIVEPSYVRTTMSYKSRSPKEHYSRKYTDHLCPRPGQSASTPYRQIDKRPTKRGGVGEQVTIVRRKVDESSLNIVWC